MLSCNFGMCWLCEKKREFLGHSKMCYVMHVKNIAFKYFPVMSVLFDFARSFEICTIQCNVSDHARKKCFV